MSSPSDASSSQLEGFRGGLANDRHVDLLIVGGGTVGCILAARASEDANRNVLVIESGPDPWSPSSDDERLRELLLEGTTLRGLSTEARAFADEIEARIATGNDSSMVGNQRQQNQRRHLPHLIRRGRGIGGSSAINGGLFTRATPREFDRWPTGWQWTDVLPWFCRIERDLDIGHPAIDPTLHGTSGPLPITRGLAEPTHPISTSFVHAARQLGAAVELDKNGTGTVGVGPLPRTIVSSRRNNTALAWLADARGRANLKIESGTIVTSVEITGGRATAVLCRRRNDTSLQRITADEIVLCAGAVRSAELLLRSGIGPAGDLTSLGIEVHADLPVGQRGGEHPQVFLPYRLRSDVRAALKQANDGATGRHSMLDYGWDLSADTNNEIRPSGSDISIHGWLDSMQSLTGQPEASNELCLGVLLQQPVGRSTVRLQSVHDSTPPLVVLGGIAHPDDRRRLRAGIQIAAELLQTSSFGALIERDAAIDEFAGNDRCDAWLEQHLSSAVHLSATAPMGDNDNDDAVLDPTCRVRGIDGLRVVDTSSFPDVPSRGPFATVVMLAERIAATL